MASTKRYMSINVYHVTDGEPVRRGYDHYDLVKSIEMDDDSRYVITIYDIFKKADVVFTVPSEKYAIEVSRFI